MNTANVNYGTTDWNSANWKKINRVVRNLRQRIFKAAATGDWKRVRSLQRLMLASYSNRLQSVRRITQVNKGKNTPGVDKVVIRTPAARGKLVDMLKTHKYPQTLPAKRTYIPKGNKKRPLGIPVIKDRAMQSIAKNALEPEWESQFESTSYGFRPGRCAHDAIVRIYNVCRGGKIRWILDADIKSAFDKISHEKLMQLIDKFPAKNNVKAWLKAGYVELGKLHETLEGTPQGGIISPLLANIVLHGMEKALGIKYRVRKSGKQKDGVKCLSNLVLVRYADDFVVICLSEEDALWAKTQIGEFLKDRGLEYSDEKTRITNLDDGFNFLGFNIRRYKVATTKSGYKLLIKPSKESQKKVIGKLRHVWTKSKGQSIKVVLKNLNPVIRGQANYYRIGVSKEIFAKWDNYSYQKQRKYVKRMHPNKSVTWKHNKYWGFFKKDSLNQWVFGDKKTGAYMLMYSDFPIERHILVKGYASPDNPFEREYWDRRELNKGKKLIPKYRLLVRKQKNRCPICNIWLTNGEELKTDYFILKANGEDDSLNNKQLLHYDCHMQLFRKEKVCSDVNI